MRQWRSLLGYTAGNPLTLRVLVRQALQEGVTQRHDLESFVTRLIGGEESLAGSNGQGRTESLEASMGYGFEGAFSRQELAQLAVLHLFRGSVDVAALTTIGDPGNAASLPELAELNRAAAIALLDRTAEIGLTATAGDGRYSLHPALPWYFGRLYTQTYGPRERHDKIVLNAYCTAIARHARQRAQLYRSGHADVITDLAADEENILNARVVASRARRWPEIMGCMHGLHVLYRHTGRQAEWAVLLRELLAEPGIAQWADDNLDDWRRLLDFQVELARDRRDWLQARSLLNTVIDRDRASAAASTLAVDPEHLTNLEKDRVRWLAASIVAYGHIMRECQDPQCLPSYDEARELYERIGERYEACGVLSHLGDACLSVRDLRDLDRAEGYYRLHLDALEEHDRLGGARVYARLARVAHERFIDGQRAGQPREELQHHLGRAADAISRAFRLVPLDAPTERGSLHDALGTILADANMIDVALSHYRVAIEIYDETDRYQVGRTRLNVARALAKGSRIQDALMYARVAVSDFESEGVANMPDIEEARRLIESLERGPAGHGISEDPDDGLGGVLAAV